MCCGSQYFTDVVVAQVCIITNLVDHKIITGKYSILYMRHLFQEEDTTLLLRKTFLAAKHCIFISKSFPLHLQSRPIFKTSYFILVLYWVSVGAKNFIYKYHLPTDDWLCRWCAPRRGITGNNSELDDEKEEAWEYHRSLLWHCLLILVGRSAESQGNGWLQHAVWKVCMPLFETRGHTRYLQQGYSFLSGEIACMCALCVWVCLHICLHVQNFPLSLDFRSRLHFVFMARLLSTVLFL